MFKLKCSSCNTIVYSLFAVLFLILLSFQRDARGNQTSLEHLLMGKVLIQSFLVWSQLCSPYLEYIVWNIIYLVSCILYSKQKQTSCLCILKFLCIILTRPSVLKPLNLIYQTRNLTLTLFAEDNHWILVVGTNAQLIFQTVNLISLLSSSPIRFSIRFLLKLPYAFTTLNVSDIFISWLKNC